MLKFGLMPPHMEHLLKSVYEEVGFYNEKYEIAGDFDFIRCFLKKKIPSS